MKKVIGVSLGADDQDFVQRPFLRQKLDVGWHERQHREGGEAAEALGTACRRDRAGSGRDSYAVGRGVMTKRPAPG
jgi:hypothetical protein